MHKNPSKIQASAIIATSELTLIRVEAPAGQLGQVRQLAALLQEEGINLEFLTWGVTQSGTVALSMAIGARQAAAFSRCRPALEALIAPSVLGVVDKIGLIGVYGPHFKEKSGILDAFLASLAEAGVAIHAAASSISSLCALIPGDDLEAARAALATRFQVPG